MEKLTLGGLLPKPPTHSQFSMINYTRKVSKIIVLVLYMRHPSLLNVIYKRGQIYLNIVCGVLSSREKFCICENK
jgi:hypothetical protein